MYSQAQIDLLKRTSDSISSEFELKWGLSKIGDSFRLEDIEKCQSIAYDPDERNDSFVGAMGLDCGFGSKVKVCSSRNSVCRRSDKSRLQQGIFSAGP